MTDITDTTGSNELDTSTTSEPSEFDRSICASTSPSCLGSFWVRLIAWPRPWQPPVRAALFIILVCLVLLPGCRTHEKRIKMLEDKYGELDTAAREHRWYLLEWRRRELKIRIMLEMKLEGLLQRLDELSK